VSEPHPEHPIAGPPVGTGGINIGREGVEIWWETGDYVGPVVIKAVNAETGDVGVMKDENDGNHFLTWPPGEYQDDVVVYQDTGGGEVGDVIASFTINVRVGEGASGSES